MRRAAVIAAIGVGLVTPVLCSAGGELMGYWPFDGDLLDASGAGRDAKGTGVSFAVGKQGQALKTDGRHVEIASAPMLQLSPGLTVDCWVYFDQRPQGWHRLVYKEGEYQLRVDDVREGGRFAFFVHLNGWEPRLCGPIPEAGHWYHLVARWTGTEMSLEVDGQKESQHRTGVPVPTASPLLVGDMSGRIDELRISNPGLAQRQRLAAISSGLADADRRQQTSFGGTDGWQGWRGELGATARADGGALKAGLTGEAAIVFDPALDLDLTGRKYVSVNLESPAARDASLVFMTDRGEGTLPFPVWGGGRTSIIDAAVLPQWAGRLRLLGLAIPGGGTHEVTVRNLWISDRPEGSPFLYARSLAPGRALLRVGREERIIAVLRSLGAEAEDAQAELVMPRGVRILDERVRRLGTVGYQGTARAEWRVRADTVIFGHAQLRLSAKGSLPRETSCPVGFTPRPNVPQASYVPEPRPARTDYLTLMHYCPLWKAGTHYGWGRIEPWPDRRPAIGWYDEGTPEVADWHIKYALEHGIQGFIYCWYRQDFSPEIHQLLGHAIHEGLLKAKYLDRFRFCIMWENGCAKGVESRDDMMRNLLPYWIRTYFKHPSYVKVDNRPVLFVWQPGRVSPELGGSEATREVFDEMRAACKKEGFDGLYLVGCVGGADENLLRQMAREGWDASSAYGIGGPVAAPLGRDVEGTTTIPYVPWLEGMRQAWTGKRKIGALPDIVDVMMGWDPRPWHEQGTGSYVAGPDPTAFRRACTEAKRIVDATPGNGLDRRLVVFDNWCEFGEGHYLEPTSGYGFGFVDAIREVFCNDTQPCVDLTPEDVGLDTPDHIYRRLREVLAGRREARKSADGLVGWWAFEDEDPVFAEDSSGRGLTGIKGDFRSTEGVKGKGFLCQGGSVTLGADELLYPATGITVELWFRTDVPDQSDRWMVNTVGAASTGYRLGLDRGRLAWQVPLSDWSHLLLCPKPVELGRWTHVAATYDNRTLRLFVNGVEQASLERGGPINPSSAGLCLGSYQPSNGLHGFLGALDEVRLYDRALTPDEIGRWHREYAR